MILDRLARWLFGRDGARRAGHRQRPASPFIDDPRDLVGRHLSSAIDSPIPDAVAIHLEQAIHQAAIARESGLTAGAKGRRSAVD